MKYCDRFFKFPVKLYRLKDLQEKSDLENKLGIEFPDDDEENLDYIYGWESIKAEQIIGFGTIFSRNKTLDDVKKEGFDSTIIYLTDGREIGCCWSPEKFESNLNEFKRKNTPWYKRIFKY